MGNATKILKEKLHSFFPILNKIDGGCPRDIHPFATSWKLSLATALLVLMGASRVQAQCAIPYVFKNPVLTSGTDRQQGATYRFSNVTPNVDAVVTITAKPAAITIVRVDTFSTTIGGYDDAWQPMILASAGSGAVTWTVTFKSKLTGLDTVMLCVPMSVVGLDRYNSSAAEYVELAATAPPITYQGTNISTTNVAYGQRATGSIVNAGNSGIGTVDTAQKNTFFQVTYANVSTFEFRTGMTQQLNLPPGRLFSLYFNPLFSPGIINLGSNPAVPICSSNLDPSLLNNSTSASTGAIYQWAFSTTANTYTTATAAQWTLVSGATAANFDPSVITASTNYVRLAAPVNTTNWIPSNVVTVLLKSPPSVSASFSTSGACTALNLQLTANVTSNPAGGALTYAWTGPNGFTSTSATPIIPNATTLQNGTYSVTVTASDFCTTAANTTVTLGSCVEICGNFIDDDGNGFVDEADPTSTCFNPAKTFACDDKLYMVRAGTDINTTLIERLTIVAGAPTLATLFTKPVQLNALGYFNGFLFAISNSKDTLYRIDAFGNIVNLGKIIGLPIPNTQWSGGTIDRNGNFYVMEGFTSPNFRLYKIPLLPGGASGSYTATQIVGTLAGGAINLPGNPTDIAIDENGTLFAFAQAPTALTANAGLYTIDLTTGLATKVGSAQFQNASLGSLFITDEGKLFGFGVIGDPLLQQKNFFEINKGTGVVTQVGAGTTPVGRSDGASCPWRVTLKRYPTTTCFSPGATFNWVFDIRNQTGQSFSGITFHDTLDARFTYSFNVAAVTTSLQTLYGSSVNIAISSFGGGTNNVVTITGINLPNTLTSSFALQSQILPSAVFAAPSETILEQAFLKNVTSTRGGIEFSDNPLTYGPFSDATPITINIITDPIITASDVSICSSSTATFSANTIAGLTYEWDFGTGASPATATGEGPTTVGYSSAGTKTIRLIVTALTGCKDTTLATLLVSDPPTSIAGSAQQKCNNGAFTLAGNTPSVGTGLWTIIGAANGAVIATPTNPTSNVTGLILGQSATLRWTITNGGCGTSATDVILTNNATPTTANAGAAQQQCNNGTFTLAGNTPSVGTGLWTIIGANNGATISSPNSPTATVLSLANGASVTLRWTISNGACPASSSDIVLTNITAPSPSNAGASQTQCNSGNFTLAANVPTIGNGLWSVVGAANGAVINAPTLANSTVSGLTVGASVTLRWSIFNGFCPPSTSDVVLTNTAAPTTANAGAGQVQCGNGTFTLAGNTPSVGTGTWSIIGATNGATITTPNSPTTTVTGLTAGQNITVRWSIINGVCAASTSDVNLSNVLASLPANAGLAQNQCNNGAFTMAANVPTAGTGAWSIVGSANGLTIPAGSVNNPTATFSSLTIGQSVTLRWTISNGICPTTTSDVVLSNIGSPTIANAGLAQTQCANGTFTMAANAPSVGTGTWSIVGNANGVTIPAGLVNNPTATFTGLTAGTSVTLQWTIANFCSSSTSNVVLTNTQTTSASNAGFAQLKCNTGTFTMAGNAPSVGTGTWSIIGAANGASIALISSPTASVSGLTAGNSVTLRWTITNGSCPATTSDVVLTNNANPTFANAGFAQTQCGSGTFTMAANAPSVGTGFWSFVGAANGANIISPSSPTTSISGLNAGASVTLRWSISNGICPASTSDVVLNNVAAKTANAGADIANCGSGNFTLAANNPAPGSGFWTIAGGVANGAVITSSTSATSTVTGLTLGKFVDLIWTVTNAPCPQTKDTVRLSNYLANSPACDCNNIYSISGADASTYGGNQIRILNTTTGTYSTQFGPNLGVVRASGLALDTVYKRFYYCEGNGTSTLIRYLDSYGNDVSTTVSLPTLTLTAYVRVGFNPVDKNVYFVSGDGLKWVAYTPTASGTGGTQTTMTTINYYPTTAPSLAGSAGGDLVFDAEGSGYIVANNGNFYKVAFSGTTVNITYLAKLNVSSGVASLAFGPDGKLYISNVGASNGTGGFLGADVYSINLQTLVTTKVNTSLTSASLDFASCSFPSYSPTIEATKTYVKFGSAGVFIGLNDELEYTVKVKNTGNISAGNVRVQDLIPAGTTYVPNSTFMNSVAVTDTLGGFRFATVPGGYQVNSNDQAWRSGSVSPGDSAVLKFRVKVTIACGQVSNTATIYHGVLNATLQTNTLTVTSSIPAISDAGPDQNNCNTPNFTMAGTVSPSYATGTWTFVGASNGATITSPTLPTTTVTGLTAGNTVTLRWTVTTGCSTASDDVVLTNVLPVTANANVDQAKCGNSSFILAANTPSVGTGIWTIVGAANGAVISMPSSPTSTVTGLTLGTSVTLRWKVTNGVCEAFDDVILANGSGVTANANVNQAKCNDGNFTLAGNTPSVNSTGLWTIIGATNGATITTPSSPTTTITGLASGTSINLIWTVSNGGCSASDDLVLINNSLPVVSITGNPNVCTGFNTTITATGGGTYAWSNGPTTAANTINPTVNTTYTVTVTNAALCQTVVSQPVTVNALPTPSISGTTTICSGNVTTLTASGGVSYAWSNGTNNVSISVNPTSNTTYTVTVTNAAGCTASTSRTVTVNPAATANITGTATVCNGNSTTLTASGGGTYAWSNGATTAANPVTPSVNTTYSVTVTNGNGCQATASRAVTVNPAASVSISGTAVICSGSSTTLTATGSGTYLWSNGSTNASITVNPLVNTTYSVTITNFSSCTASASQLVTVNAIPVVNITGTTAICNGNSTTLTATGGGTYKWNDGTTNNSIFINPNSTTTYSVTVTNSSNSCQAARNQVVTVNPLPVAVITGATGICSGLSTILTASGGGTYKWDNNAITTSITVTPSVNTTYSVTVTDANGCVGSTSKTVNVSPTPSSNAGPDQTLCVNTFTLAASPLTGTQTGLWTVISGKANIVTPTSPTSSVTIPLGAPVTLRWTVSESACNSTDDVVLQAIYVNAGSDQRLCAPPAFTMTANVPIVGTGAWSIISGTPTLASLTSPTTSVTLPIGTVATLRWTITGSPCGVIYDDVVISNFQAFTADAGADQVQCNNGVFTFSPGATSAAACAANAAVVNGSFESPYQAPNTWSPVDEINVLGWKTTALDKKIEFWGTTFLGVTSQQGAQHVELNANLFSGLYQDLCVLPGDSINWSVAHRGRDGVDSMMVKIGVPGALVEQTRVGTGNTAWVIYSGGYRVPAGQTVTRYLFEALSTATGNIAIGNLLDNVNVTLIDRKIIPGFWSIVSGVGNIVNPSDPNTSVTGVPAGTSTTLRWTSNNGVCSSFDDLVVTNNPLPVITVPANQSICNGASTTAINFASSAPNTTYNWTNSNPSIGLAASGTSNNIPAFVGINNTSVDQVGTITVTPTANGCQGNPITFTITVKPIPTVNAVPNQVLCAGATSSGVILSGTPAGTTYSWTNNNTAIGLATSGTGILPAFTAANNTTNPITSTVTITPSLNGCVGTPTTMNYTVNPTPVALTSTSTNTMQINFGSVTCNDPYAPQISIIANPYSAVPPVLSNCGLGSIYSDYYGKFISYNPKDNYLYTADISDNATTKVYRLDLSLQSNITCPLVPSNPTFTYPILINNFEFDAAGDLWVLTGYNNATGQCNIGRLDEITGVQLSSKILQFPVGANALAGANINNGDIVILPNGRMFGTFGNSPSKLYEIMNYATGTTGDATAVFLANMPRNTYGIAYVNGRLSVTGTNFGTDCYYFNYNIGTGTLDPTKRPSQNGQSPIDNTSITPAVGATKRLIGVMLNNNSADLTYEVYVKNTGNVLLNNVNVDEDLAKVFGAANVVNVSISFPPGGNTAGLVLSSTYNGITDTKVFASGQQLPNEAPGFNNYAVKMLVRCRVNNLDVNKTYLNSAIGEGNVGTWNASCNTGATIVRDSSNNGLIDVIDPNMDGDSGGLDENIPTPFRPMILTTTQVNVQCAGDATGSATVNVQGGIPTFTYIWSSTPTQTSKTAVGLPAGVYTVTVSDAGGLTAFTTVTITDVNPKPVAAISGTGAVCGGTGTILTASGGGTYNWSNGATTAANPVTPSVNTTYTVTVTNSFGCTNTASRLVTINANPTAAITGTSIVCNGTSTTLTATGGTTYSWNTTPVQTTAAITVTPSVNTTYSVTVTDANGCTARTSQLVTVSTKPTVTPLPNQSLCATPNFTLNEPPSPVGFGEWTIVGATNGATITAVNNPSTNILGVASGTSVMLKWKVVNGACADSISVVLSNLVTPVLAPTNTGPYCQGATIQLNGNITSGATGGTWSWTGPNGFTSNLENPTILNASASTAGVYFVTYNIGGCASSTYFTTVTLGASPAAPTTANVNYCVGQTATALTATGSNLLWYTAATGGTGSATAPTPSTATAAVTLYFVSQTTGTCESPRSQLAVTVSASPSAPQASDRTYCLGQTATALTATGTALKWYTAATGGTGSATAPTPSTATVGTSLFYVSQTVGICESPRSTITVNVIANPAAPSVSDVNYCVGQTAAFLTASGTNLLWYTTATGGTASSAVPKPSTTTAGTQLFYVTQTVGACESPRSLITVTVNAIPAAPSVSNVNYCVGQTATALTATGSNLLWYTASTGGTGSATAPTPSTASAGSTTYYVTQTTNACESPRSAITVNVTSNPAAPSVSNVNYCVGQTATALTATGSNLLWYTAATGGTGSATAPTPSTASAGSTTYYVSQTSGTCESPRSAITVNVTSNPSAPIVSNVNYCVGQTATALTATGTALKWYTVATGGTSSATAPTPSTASVSSITYYVSQTSGTCESPRSAITVNVTSNPAAPSVSNVNYCVGQTATALTATGSNLLWYTASTGGTGSATAPTPSTASAGSTTYYVTQTTGTCESPRSAITVNVTSNPAAPSVSNVNYCVGQTATALTATGSNLLWYTAATGGTGSATAPTPSTATAGSTTYYVSQTSGTCESPRSAITVNVTSNPSAPTVSNVNYCVGQTATALTATGTALKWYTVATGGTSSATAPTPSTASVSSITYYVSQTSGTCESPRSAITVNVTSNPAAPTVSNVRYCIGATPTALTATGTNLLWYANATGGTGSATAPTPTTTAAGTQTYYVSQTTGTCESPRSAITVTINALPIAQFSFNGGTSYCSNITPATQFMAQYPGGGQSGTGPFNYLWSTGETTQTIDVVTTATTTYSLTVTSSGIGCSNVASQTITIIQAPVVTISGNKRICLGGFVPLKAEGGNPGDTYLWSNNLTSQTFGITPTQLSVNVSVTITTPAGCTGSATVTVLADANTPSNAGVDVNNCNNPTVTLAANAPSVGTGTWSVVSPSGFAIGNVSNVNQNNATVSNVAIGSPVTLRWTVVNGLCSNTDDVVLTNYPTVTADAGLAQNQCNTSTFTMAATTPSVGTGVWSVVSPAGFAVSNISNINSNTTTVSNVVTGTPVTLRWTVSNVGCSSSATVVLTNGASVAAANAGVDISQCNSTTFSLNATNPSSGTGVWSVVSPSGFPISNVTNVNSRTSGVNNVLPGAPVTLRWTVTNGACSSSDDVVLTNNGTVVANAGPDIFQCNTPNFTLLGTAPTLGTGVWSIIGAANGAVISTTNDPNSALNGLTVGNSVTLRWTVANGTCTATDDVVLNNNATVVANAGPDLGNCGNGTFYPNATTFSAPASGAWTVVSPSSFATTNLSSLTSRTITVQNVPVGTPVTLRWTLTNGACSSSDDVVLTNSQLIASNAGPDLFNCNNTDFTLAGNAPTGTTGKWTVSGSPNGAVITNSTSATSTITGLTLGASVTMRWTVSNGACSTFDDVVLTNSAPVVANAGPDLMNCNNGTFYPNAATFNSPASGAWTVISPSSFATTNLSSLTSRTITVSNVPVGTPITLRWTLTNGACTSSDDVVITNNAPVSVAAMPNMTQCNNPSFTLAAATPSVGTGVWTVVSPAAFTTANISNVNSNNATVSNVVAGTPVTLRWTVTNGTGSTGVCSSSATVVLTNNAAVTANANVDQQKCNNGSFLLAANAVTSPAVGGWSVVGAANGASISNLNSPNASALGLTAGNSVTLRWTVTNGSGANACSSSDDVVLTNFLPVAAANAGVAQTKCDNGSFLLAATAPSVGTGVWSVVSPVGFASANISDVNSNSATLSNVATGNPVTLRWTVTNGTGPNACTTSATVVLTNNAAVTTNAGVDQQKCNINTFNMAATFPTVGTGLWTRISGGTVTIVNTASPITSITNLGVGQTVTLRWTVTNGACSTFDEVVLTNNPSVSANAGPDVQNCNGSAFVLNATAPSVGTGAWSVISGTATLADASLNNSAVTIPVGQTVTLRWTVSLAGSPCSSSDDVVLTNNQLTTAAAGNDQLKCGKPNFLLSATEPPFGIGTWTFLGGINNGAVITNVNNQSSTLTGLNPNTSVQLIWTVNNGNCSIKDTVRLTNSAVSPSCNCDAIFAIVKDLGDDKMSSFDPVTNTYGPQFGQNLLSNTYALALDTVYRRFYYSGTGTGAPIYYMDTLGVSYPTGVNLPATDTYTRAGFNPVDKKVYFIGSNGNAWVSYEPTPAGTGGAITNFSPVRYYPISAPVLSAGGDIVFDNDGNGYIITHVGNFYRSVFNADNTVDVIYLGKINLPITQLASLAFGPNNKLYISGTGSSPAGIYTIDLETLQTGVANAFISGSSDFTSCNFPVYRGSLETAKTYSKVGGIPGLRVNSGDTLEYRIAVRHQGNISVGNVRVIDTIPAGTTYVAGSTKVNGVSVTDTLGGFRYEKVPGGFAVNSTNQALFTGAINPLDSAVVTFRVRVDISCGQIQNVATVLSSLLDYRQKTNTVIVTSEDIATAQAGADFHSCNATSIVMPGNLPPSSGYGLWKVLSGTAAITNPSLYNTTVTGVPVGSTATLEWYINNGICSEARDTITIYNDYPVVANAGSDIAQCNIKDFTMNANEPIVGVGVWSIVSGTAVISDTNDPFATVQNVALGASVTLRWTVTNEACTTFDEVVLTNSLPITTVNAGLDQSKCSNGSFTLAATTPSVGTGVWSIIGLANGATITSPSSPTSAVSGLSVGNSVTLRWTVTNGGCSSSDDVVLNNNLPLTANAGSAQSQCSNGTFNLSATDPSVGTGIWSVVSPSGFSTSNISNVNLATATLQNVSIGSPVTLQWTITNGACTSSATVVLSNVASPTTTVFASTTSACVGDSISFSLGSITSGTTYTWNFGTGAMPFTTYTGTTPPRIAYTTCATRNVQVTATSASGCSSNATVSVTTNDLTKPVFSNVPASTTAECSNIPTISTNVTAADNCIISTLTSFETSTKGCDTVTYYNGLSASGAANPSVTNEITAQTRIGGIASPYEISLNHPTTSAPIVSNPADINWVAGVPKNFALYFNPNATGSDKMIFVIEDGATRYFVRTDLTNFPTVNQPIDFNALRISLNAGGAAALGGSLVADNLLLNGTALQNMSATGVSNNLLVTGWKFNQGTVLTGRLTMNWTGAKPTNSAINFGVSLGNAPLNCNNACKNQNYTISRNWIAKDGCGNVSSVAQIIRVQDTQAPTFGSVPANVTLACATLPTAAIVTATDNCDPTPTVAPVVETSTKTTNGTCTDSNYTITRTWTATDACGNSRTASQVITVISAPIVSISIDKDSVCNGAGVLLTSSLNCQTGFSQTYQWQSSPDGTTWNNVASGGTSANYSASALTQTTYFRLLVTQSTCSATSGTVKVEVVAPPSVSVAVSNATVCNGGNSTLTATVTGGVGTITTYQWQESFSGTAWSTIFGATNATYTATALTFSKFFRVVVTQTGASCTTTSTATQIIVVPNPSVTQQPQGFSECVGGTLSLSVTATGGTPALTYQWQTSANGSTGWTDMVDSTNASFIPNSIVTGTFYYRVKVSAAGSNCATTTSNPATVIINPDPVVAVSVPTTQVCEGGRVTLTASPSGGSGTCTIQWQSSPDGVSNFTDIVPTATGNTYQTQQINVATKYRAVLICNGNGCCN